MRRIAVLVLAAGLFSLMGCATLTDSPEDVRYTYKRKYDMEMRQLSADWNKFWLADRHNRLSKWYTH